MILKPGLSRSPLAVDFPDMPPIAGVEMATARAGFYAHPRDDLLVMRFAPGTACAGVFTRHGVGSAPVDWCRAQLAASGGAARGPGGQRRLRQLLHRQAGSLGGGPGGGRLRPAARLPAAAGDAGQHRGDRRAARRHADHRPPRRSGDRLFGDGWGAAAAAIMTTDTFAKGATAAGGDRRCAGSHRRHRQGLGHDRAGHGHHAGFVATDAAIAPAVLQGLIRAETRRTFNAVTVDGDRSTNDTLLVFATGQAGNRPITRPGDPRLLAFKAALHAVLLDLAQQLVRDGEGASKFVRIAITGARNDASARKIARTVAESPLVKTAFAGEDANWGRIVMAVGRADEPVNRERMSVTFGPLTAARHGRVAADYDEAAMSAYMKQAELEVSVDVGVGSGAAVMWTCDLTKQYVAINGDYRS